MSDFIHLFLYGMGQAFNLTGANVIRRKSRFRHPSGRRSDLLAIRRDALAVGGDMRKAMAGHPRE